MQTCWLSPVSDWQIAPWVTCALVAPSLVGLAMSASLSFLDRLIYPRYVLVNWAFWLEGLERARAMV